MWPQEAEVTPKKEECLKLGVSAQNPSANSEGGDLKKLFEGRYE